MRNLFLDLETIPSQNPAVKTAIYARPAFRQVTEIGPIEPAANLKDPEKIAKSILDRTEAAFNAVRESNLAKDAAAEKAWRDTALDGWFGRIAVIGFAVNDEPVESITCIDVKYDRVWFNNGDTCGSVIAGVHIDVSTEKQKIEAFFAMLGDGPLSVVGHRVRKFDLLFLRQRCIVLGIKPPYWLTHAKDSTRHDKYYVNDTSEMAWTTLSNKPFGPSLNRLCEALGIPVKGDIDGSRVWDEICSGNLLGVAEYCRWDVRRVRSVWRRINGLAPLEIDMPAPVREVAA